MRRVLAVSLTVVALLGAMVADASAQAPVTTKVTISGLVDTITSYTRNLSIVDLSYNDRGDTEWYARNRLRPDITAEVGTTKFVLGLEMDYAWGQTGATDVVGPNRAGTSAGADLNTDLGAAGNSIIELKWGYVEFGVPGMPWASRIRLGAQPWATTYKTAVLATGDFAGAHFTSTLTPMVKLNLTFGQAEEESTGARDGFLNGEDFAIITSVEITPFKGLDIRPIYAYFKADGPTNVASRQGRGGVANAALTTTAAAVIPLNAEEQRHTIGVDARWRGGPFSFEPTVFYQFGEREIARIGSPTLRREQDLSAWFVDLRGGFQTGPLLLEAAAIYTSGNKAEENITNARNDVNFYQPISTDTSYYATWAEHWALGIDYFNILYSGAAGLNPGVAIGYDKYGLIRVGARASYAVTPAFTVRGAVTANWTAEKVDTDGTIITAAGGRNQVVGAGLRDGDERYLGTEVDLGFQWRFAPGLAFDVVGAYTFAGDALGSRFSLSNNGVLRSNDDVKDVQTVSARLRYTF